MCLSWKFTSVVSRLLPTKWSLLQCFNGGWPSFGACWGLWEVVLKSVLRHLTAGCYWWNRSCSSADFFCQERSDELHKQETKTRHELEDTGVALQAAGTPSFFVQLHIVSRSYIYIYCDVWYVVNFLFWNFVMLSYVWVPSCFVDCCCMDIVCCTCLPYFIMTSCSLTILTALLQQLWIFKRRDF